MFEWEDAKNQANIAKHGVSFEQAAEIFDGFVYTVRDRRRDYGEDRFRSTGRIGAAAMVVVVHVDRNGTIRMISARPASRKERHAYQAKIRAAPDTWRNGGAGRQRHRFLGHSGTR